MNISPLFSLKDYDKYCMYDDALIKSWAFAHLTKLYPEEEITKNWVYKLLKNLKDDSESNIRNKIYSYLQENVRRIPAKEIYDFLQNNEDINNEDKAFLLKILARKQYEVNNILKRTISILSNNEIDFNTYYRLQETLINLKTQEAYQLLKKIESKQLINIGFSKNYNEEILKYKNIDDIKILIKQEINNLDKNNVSRIFYVLSEYYYGRGFLITLENFRDNDFKKVMESLKKYWPENKGIKELDYVVDNAFIVAYNSQNYKIVFNKLANIIIENFCNKYKRMKWSLDSFNLEMINKFQGESSLEDYWIAVILSLILNFRQSIYKKNSKLIISLLLSMLIVILEDNNFEMMVKKARKNRYYLWHIFTLDRDEIPEKIEEMVYKQGKKFEDKAISFIINNKYTSRNERLLNYLGEINSLKSVPEIINLIDDKQGYHICDRAKEALEKIKGISPETIKKGLENGDETTISYISSVLEWLPCDSSAEIIINSWEKGEFVYQEVLVNTLKNIGSKIGYDYLKNAQLAGKPEYLFEALYILAVVTKAPQSEIKKYRDKLEESKSAKNNYGVFNWINQLKKEKELKKQRQQKRISGDKYQKIEHDTIVRKKDKVGRNDPCPCGSGKKYKKCCAR